MVLWPITMIFILFIFWSIFKLIKKITISDYLPKRMLLSIFAVFYISYINVTKVLVRMLYCVDILVYEKNEIRTKEYWADDTAIACNAGDHRILISVFSWPLILVFSFGFPLFTAGMLLYKRWRKELSDMRTYETMGFLYRAYQEKYVFWDSVVMLRKAVLAVIVVFAYPLGGNLQVTFSFLIILYLYLNFNFYT